MPPIYVCFLENDEEIMERHWLNAMAAESLQHQKQTQKSMSNSFFHLLRPITRQMFCKVKHVPYTMEEVYFAKTFQ